MTCAHWKCILSDLFIGLDSKYPSHQASFLPDSLRGAKREPWNRKEKFSPLANCFIYKAPSWVTELSTKLADLFFSFEATVFVQDFGPFGT